MADITKISWTIRADACGDDDTAAAFAAWAHQRLQASYPDAEVTVSASNRTAEKLDVELADDDEEARAEVAEETNRLWDEWIDEEVAAMTGQDLRAQQLADGWTVVDLPGRRWWPDDAAQEEISSDDAPAERALAMCRQDPARGVWHS